VDASAARRRGIHVAPETRPGAPRSDVRGVAADSDKAFAAAYYASSLQDAVCGALIGMAIGDALAASLHWIYSWPEAGKIKEQFFGGRIRDYESTPDGMQHPDSWKYFQRCDPSKEPFPQAFGNTEDEIKERWNNPGTPYHATVPKGDNTLSARIVAKAIQGFADNGCFDADAYLADYLDTVINGRSKGFVNDTWLDEAPRVLLRNLARGFLPSASGLDDCCLTGLALSMPTLLAYLLNRDAADLACRSQIQFSHKSEDMATQVQWLGDLLRGIVAATGAVGNSSGASNEDDDKTTNIKALFEGITLSFSNDKVSLPEVIAKFTSTDPSEPPWKADEAAYHGPEAVFSSR
jgi:ADP-ribosylglycohydrolase